MTRTVDDGMADLSLDSPSAFRLVAAAAATVGSLALVALGVQIGTDGLGSLGPDRNPASETIAPAAAVVDQGRVRGAQGLDQTLRSLVPLSLAPLGSGAAAGSAGLDGPTGTNLTAPGAGSTSAAGPNGTAGPSADPAPAPAPGPTSPIPVPVPTPEPVPLTPAVPALPDPAPVLEPLAPVLDPLLELVGGSSSSSSSSPSTTPSGATTVVAAPAPAQPTGLLPTLTGLLGL